MGASQMAPGIRERKRSKGRIQESFDRRRSREDLAKRSIGGRIHD